MPHRGIGAEGPCRARPMLSGPPRLGKMRHGTFSCAPCSARPSFAASPPWKWSCRNRRSRPAPSAASSLPSSFSSGPGPPLEGGIGEDFLNVHSIILLQDELNADGECLIIEHPYAPAKTPPGCFAYGCRSGPGCVSPNLASGSVSGPLGGPGDEAPAAFSRSSTVNAPSGALAVWLWGIKKNKGFRKTMRKPLLPYNAGRLCSFSIHAGKCGHFSRILPIVITSIHSAGASPF